MSRFLLPLAPLLASLPALALQSLALPALTLPALAAPEAAIVRQARAPQINGEADEWQGLPVHFVKAARGVIAEFQLGYDPGGLSLFVKVRDSSPLKNSASINDPAMMLKNGDAIGLTFGPADGVGREQRILLAQLGGKPQAVVYRPKSEVKQPYTFESPVGKVTHEYVALLPEVSAVFKTTADGYNAEIRLPWSTLGYTPREGLSFPFDLQVILSDAAGQVNTATAWWHSVGGGPLATVDLPTEARLYPELWGRARLYATAPLTPERRLEAGPPVGVPIKYSLTKAAKVSLNITDERGWILRELMVAQPHGAGAFTTYWNGRDEYGDPMPPGKYRWKALYFDGIGSKRLGGAGNSARPPFRTPDGKGDLGAVHGYPAALAADATGLYHLSGTEEGNPGLTKLDAAGFTLWKRSLGSYGNGVALAADEKFAYMIVQVGGNTRLVSMDAATGKDLAVGAKGARFTLGPATVPVRGLAVLAQKAYYALPESGTVGVLNLQTGEPETPLAVPDVQDIQKWSETELALVSGTQVLLWDIATGQSKPLLSGLDAARAFTRDKQGNVYVAQAGTSQQILKFSPQAKLLTRMGTPGGRPATAIPYDAAALRNIRSLTVGPDGNLWFLENSELRRAGAFNLQGQWVKDLYQTLPSQGGAGVDLDDPVRVFFHTGYDSLVAQARIDFGANAKDPTNPASYWKLEALYNMTATGDYTEPGPDDVAALSTKGPFYNPIAFTGSNGKRYLWHEGNTASLWIKENRRLVPLHVIGTNNREGGTLFPKGKKFSWSDADGDGKFAATEIDLTPGGADGWRWIDRDLKLYGDGGTLKPYKVDARGVPFYKRSDWQPDVTSGRPVEFYFRDGSYGIFPSPPAEDGARYSVFNIGAGQQTSFWDRATHSRIARVKDGAIQWIAGQHDGTKRNPGGAVYLWRPLGEVDGVMVVGDVDFHLLAYTKDGFGLGGVTPHYSEAITPESIVQENVQAGHFVKDPKTGKPLVIIGSGTEALVLEVTGLEPGRFSRTGGDLVLPNAVAASPQTPGQYSILYRTWPQRDNGRYFGVTGDGWGWRPEIPWLTVKDGTKHLADVRLRRDAGALHVFATVLDKTPFVGPATATPGASDGLELLLAPPTAAATAAGKPPYTRLFLSGQTKGNGLEGVLLARSSASADAAFKVIPGAKIAARPTLNGYGYRLEAEIPLGFFGELSRERTVTYIRNYQKGATRPGDLVETYTAPKPDLPGPIRFNVAIWQTETSGTRRVPWVQDGGTATGTTTGSVLGTDVTAPERWGMANALVALNWPYRPGSVNTIYRSKTGKLEDAIAIETKDADYTGDTPGLGTFSYWVDSVAPGAPPQLAGPLSVSLDNETNSEPILTFDKFAPNPAFPFEALPVQKLFPGATVTLEVQLAAQKLELQAANPLVQVKTQKLDANRWRIFLAAAPTVTPDLKATLQLKATLANGTSRTVALPLEGTPLRLAGLMEKTGGVLQLSTDALAAGDPVTQLNWPGRGGLERQKIGSAGYVLFRHGGYAVAVPTRKIMAPFLDTFGGGDGFWYGDNGGNMRFDLDGKEGRDASGIVRFGSVNSNAGTPDKGPGTTWKINVTDEKPHYLTLFSPAKNGRGAKQRITVTTATNVTESVEFDGSQGGTVLQFAFIGSITVTTTQTVGGSGSSDPGANCAALFLD